MKPVTYECTLRHTRVTPLRHAFRYRSYEWLVDLDHLPRNRILASFRPGLRADLDSFLTGHDVHLDGGRVLMLTNPRVLGYAFNPLTVYWCHRPGGRLAAVVAEVHNTYGGRHRYLLHTDERGRCGTGKQFYVSPFFPVDGSYRMNLPLPGDELDLTVALDRDGGRPFVATLHGRRVSDRPLRHAMSTLAAMARIKFQGIRLYARGLPLIPRQGAVR